MMPPCQIQIPTNVILWLYRIGIVLIIAMGTWIVADQLWRTQ